MKLYGFKMRLRQGLWDFHWRLHRDLKERCARAALTPRPPDENYRGERARNLERRYIGLLLDTVGPERAKVPGLQLVRDAADGDG